jgi:hypothetical protein
MDYDLGFFDEEADRVECAENPFGAKVSTMSPYELSAMSPEWTL